MSHSCRFWWIRTVALLGVALSGLTTAPAEAIEVETRWGFGSNKIVLDEFNRLEVILTNDTPDPFQADVKLEVAWNRVGAPHIERVYLAPGTQRRLVFYPRITNHYRPHVLRWGLGPKASHDITAPAIGARNWVVLAPDSRFWNGTSVFPSFPAAQLPTSAAKLRALAHIVVGDDLVLSAEQTRALVEWVHAGGVLHFCPRGDTYPKLASAFPFTPPRIQQPATELGPFDRSAGRLGVGRVLFQEVSTNQLSWRRLEQQGWYNPGKARGNARASDSEIASSLLSLLRRPFRWAGVVALCLLYFIFVVPVNFFVARRPGAKTRTSVLYFVGCSLLFSFLFFYAGREGRGDNRSCLLTYARPLPGDRYELLQWGASFVTRSGRFELTRPEGQQLFGSVEDNQPVPGLLLKDRYQFDIPLFSSRGFVNRGATAGPRFLLDPPQFENWRVDPHPGTRLRLRLSDEARSRFRFALVVNNYGRGKLYEGDPELPMSAVPILGLSQKQEAVFQRHYYNNRRSIQEQQHLRDVALAICARAVENSSPPTATAFGGSIRDHQNEIDLFLVLDGASLFVPNGAPGDHAGRIIVHYRYPLPE